MKKLTERIGKAVLGLSVIAGGLALATPAHAQTYYQWQNNKNRNYCLGIAADNMTNGTHAIVWQCNSVIHSADQAWTKDLNDEFSTTDGPFFSYRNGSNFNKCLGIDNDSVKAGAQAMIWDCFGPPVHAGHQDQYWQAAPEGPAGCVVFWNGSSGMVLGVAAGNVTNGTNVVQWPEPVNGPFSADQIWCPVQVSP